VDQWRVGSAIQSENQVEADIRDRAKPDISLYKERGDEYPIIGNAMLLHAAETERRYVNENVEQIAKTFDPIRIRIRVMPTGRVPNTQGKTADYYFKEAAKKSVAGELTYGIELLKKGLLINPNHMQCRFNHGVLMFKFGLVREALEDFETIVRNHPRKELWAYYNRAICLIQLEEVVFSKEEMKAGKILFEPRWEDDKMHPKPFFNK
jgi:tetratricopeptide (TPR) repeat protein